MYPEFYKGVHGYEYRIEDVLPETEEENMENKLLNPKLNRKGGKVERRSVSGCPLNLVFKPIKI